MRFEIEATVNLGDYENIRVRVEGDDVGETILMLDDVLGRFGVGDDPVSKRIDSYRKRVLGGYIEMVEGKPEPVVEVEETPPVVVAPERPPVKEETPSSPKGVDLPGECVDCGVGVSKVQMDVSKLFFPVVLCKACMDGRAN